jgi:hypothetical protein
MRSSIAAILITAMMAGAANAQAPAPGPGQTANAPGARPYAPQLPFSAIPPVESPTKRDSRVKPAQADSEPVPPEELQAPTMELPQEPVDPYLLTKDVGPFLVLAKTFRGPDAEKFALALVLEIRNRFGYPAYILRTKDFANRSLIRNIPPTAPPGLMRPNLTAPEKFRTTDEAAVLIGNEKTLEDSAKLLKVVKKMKPECLSKLPHLYSFSKNLKGAIRTTNPYVPAQDLFPATRDKYVESLNDGKRSIYHCPGRYSLEIAQFTGRSTFNVQAAMFSSADELKTGSLAKAYDNAENLAEALAKVPLIRETGQPVYVYHDRTSSRVFIGSFNSTNDAAAASLREHLVKNALLVTEMVVTYPDKRKELKNPGVKTVITPATYLTDLDDPQQPIRPTK